MIIKKATFSDLDSLTELFDLYRVFYEQTSNQEEAREFLKARIMNDESVVFMAFDGNDPVGFVQLYPSFSSVSMMRSWVLNDLYVKEQFRGRGAGEKLIHKAIEFAKATGAKGVLLETGVDNHNAQRLYEKIGFEKETNYFYYFSI
ncbi:GNAT family N-acetyltransferase [Neobacillus sp. OS1-33]|uniref:GNAT family N-acetyltransferase n=1 Tax=Neobacillus sp. OS1-33 TaxID=3070683 RepID=UPI0027DF19CA|nr:GNAT family N-acetyltransferase [Neobacillus sp. OS1-33]WML26695.1 GNAT family N-acetyltransferase [Neobacillus sp. OS1-33]